MPFGKFKRFFLALFRESTLKLSVLCKALSCPLFRILIVVKLFISRGCKLILFVAFKHTGITVTYFALSFGICPQRLCLGFRFFQVRVVL